MSNKLKTSDSNIIMENGKSIWAVVGLFFLILFMGSMENSIQKWMALLCSIGIFVVMLLPKSRERLGQWKNPILLLPSLYVVWCGISAFYAVSGKFAIVEFTKILAGFFIFLIVILFGKNTLEWTRKVAGVFASATALIGFISVDAASVGIFSGVIKAMFGKYIPSLMTAGGYEAGIRIKSILLDPNLYSGVMSLGVLLSLFLLVTLPNGESAVLSKSKSKLSTIFCVILLAVNALSYLLAFSMGSLFVFFLACVLMLILTQKDLRLKLFSIMAETAVTSLIMAFVAMKGLGAQGATAWLPLLALIVNVVLLYLAYSKLTPILSGTAFANTEKTDNNMAKAQSRKPALIIGGFAILAIGYIALALNISGPISMKSGEMLMRAIYVPGGTYELKVESSTPSLYVKIESQNDMNLVKRTANTLYMGPISTGVDNGTVGTAGTVGTVSFEVPEDSKIVRINYLATNEDVTIAKSSYSGPKSGDISLKYTLLPGFIANRIQNLGANENAIQRTVFFEDGLKIFKTSPILGKGLGGFETAVVSVQNYYYETKYAHNHYIQSLCDLGIPGFLFFVGILFSGIYVLFSSRKKGINLFAIPVGAACLFQMFGQGTTDAIWSSGGFLILAFGILGMLVVLYGKTPVLPREEAHKQAEKKPEKKSKNADSKSKSSNGKSIPFGGGNPWQSKVLPIFIMLFSLVFVVSISLNLYASKNLSSGKFNFDDLDNFIQIDRFDTQDYITSYLLNAPTQEDPTIISKANAYAEDLMKRESNIVFKYLMDYYFATDQDEQAFQAAFNGFEYNKANPYACQMIFDSLESNIDPVSNNGERAMQKFDYTAYYVPNVLKLYEGMKERNKTYWDVAYLTPRNDTFISKFLIMKDADNYNEKYILNVYINKVFDTDFPVDVDSDLIPDSMQLSWPDSSISADGIINVPAGQKISFKAVQKMEGRYRLIVECDNPETVSATYNGESYEMEPADGSAMGIIELENNYNLQELEFVLNFDAETKVKRIAFLAV